MKLSMLFMLGTLAFNVNAAINNGNDLYNVLHEEEVNSHNLGITQWDDVFEINGYIHGETDALANKSIPIEFRLCFPNHTTQGQIIDIVHQYLENNPSIRNEDASYLTYNALKQFYSCKLNKTL